MGESRCEFLDSRDLYANGPLGEFVGDALKLRAKCRVPLDLLNLRLSAAFCVGPAVDPRG